MRCCESLDKSTLEHTMFITHLCFTLNPPNLPLQNSHPPPNHPQFESLAGFSAIVDRLGQFQEAMATQKALPGALYSL